MNFTKGESLFCSKVLLFGEYLVVKGGRAIAVPYHHFSGELKFGSKHQEKNYCLRDFVEFISHSKMLSKAMDANRLGEDLEKGLYFDSNIPTGHGVGSSGALCAAIFKNYSVVLDNELEDFAYLKDILALMESFFHGVSSGLDPLVSYIQKPLEIKNRNDFNVIWPENFKLLKNFYLVDTGITRKTAPLVHSFLNLCENEQFKAPLNEMLQANTDLVSAFLAGDATELKKNLYQLSYLQYIWLDKMIPQSFRKFWLDALESKKYFVKLCGAGGGGFLLVYAENPSVLNVKSLPLA